MNGELAPGTYRARNGDLIHCRDDYEGHTVVETEDRDGTLTWADQTALRGAVRISDDPDWPLRNTRLSGVLTFD